MSVTVHPASTQRYSYSKFHYSSPAKTAVEVLNNSVRKQISRRCKEIFQTSLDADLLDSTSGSIYASSNSFVSTVCDAYNHHHDLILRPDDVWLAILTQFNLYVNANGEELRHLFVSFDGKKEVKIDMQGTRQSVDFGEFAIKMGEKLQENLVDPSLHDWIIPNFTTSSANDVIVASIVMMATLKTYFDYTCGVICGLPSVTLLGTRNDWTSLVDKIAKLKEFGPVTKLWHDRLYPVLTRFVKSFDDPTSRETLDFWNKICHYTSVVCGLDYLTGWITAFCFFDATGKPLFHDHNGKIQNEEYVCHNGLEPDPSMRTVLDGVLYHRIMIQDIPQGYADVPVKIIADEQIFSTIMVAGLIATRVTDSGIIETKEDRESKKFKRIEYSREEEKMHDGKGDVVQPLSGWWLFDAKSEEEAEAEDRRKQEKRWKEREERYRRMNEQNGTATDER